nr:immunoglobulin heavy chain junction region [Mus musculus]MBK4186071.1 immunoglobulin heavy chain junction region [Mus musculus]
CERQGIYGNWYFDVW